MSKEIPLRLIVGALSNEKGVSEEVIFEAIEAALVSATKKKYGADIDVRIDIDKKTGIYDTYRVWTVVEDPEPNVPLEFPLAQITLSAARYDNKKMELGDTIEEPMESVEFGRIAVQTAKQVIIQKVREAERAKLSKEFLGKIGELLNGTVKKNTKDGIIVDLGSGAEGFIAKDQLLPRESFRMGDRIRAYLFSVETEVRGPQIFLSRTHKGMLEELFKIEVPEVGEGIIEIKGVSRDPGARAKIAVKTNDGRIDPVGACVGMRGARVQAVSNELNGERVDIVLWDEDPAQFVMNAMAPAEIVSIVVDDDVKTMDVAVSEAHLSQAIGRNGQNVKLASDLSGWKLNVVSEVAAKEETEAESTKLRDLFMKSLDVEEDLANILIEEGFTSLEEIAYVPIQEFLEIDGFDEEIVNQLRERAKDVLLTEAIAKEEAKDEKKPEKDLLEVEGVTEELANILASKDIVTRDDLADLAVDDLIEITDLDRDEAAKIIMAAREHWFSK